MMDAFVTLVDQSSSPMAVLDGQGRFKYANRAFANLFGTGADPCALVDLEWASLLSEDAGEEFVHRILPAAMRGGWEGELAHGRVGRADARLSVRILPVPKDDDVILAVAITEPARGAQRAGAPAVPTAAAAPILPIAHRVIVVPIVGALDARRSSLLMRSVLAGITTHRAKAVIIDVTGLSEIDNRAADYLAKTVLAARLKGARTVVSGVSQEASEALTDIDVDWKGIATVGDLGTALSTALSYVGITMQSTPKGTSSHAG
ncbi:MAG: PAS domain-containing protein [Deltaproteobacteria bacterium]|nr:PAS domain-containing protein [Deltaproteobacteria bacterium]